jgi:hypothetical protein
MPRSYYIPAKTVKMRRRPFAGMPLLRTEVLAPLERTPTWAAAW